MSKEVNENEHKIIEQLLEIQKLMLKRTAEDDRKTYYARASDPVGNVRVFRCQYCDDGEWVDKLWAGAKLLAEFTPIYERMIEDGRSKDANTFAFVARSRDFLKSVGVRK